MAAVHEHGAGSAPGHAGARHRGRLAAVFLLSLGFLAVELTAGLLSGSLALVSDAGHMATDVVALGASWVATRIAGRADSSGRRSYGYYRHEVFASALAVLLMVGVGVFVTVEAVRRIASAPVPASGVMLAVGAAGLVVNVAGILLLRRGAGEALVVRGAYLEVVADAAGSVGVIVAAVLVGLTGAAGWDTVVGLGIGVFVVVRAVVLGRQVLAVLAQHAPHGLDPAAVEADLAAVPAVVDVHDLHLWTLTSGMNVATAHLVTDDDADPHAVLDTARDLLGDRYGIEHATLQVEPASHTGCHEVGW